MYNALAGCTSPYLRLHQDHPVHWQPWGEAAFASARSLGRPVLLSVGYAACHWCHVMARESFEDPATAALMNEWFVNVKVDREERPDVDALYIRALRAMGKRAGWPLTMFLLPDGRPFGGGTYFPPVRRGRVPAFRDALARVRQAFDADPAAIAVAAGNVIDALADAQRLDTAGQPLSPAQGVVAARRLLEQLDPADGGLQGAPKFPYPALFCFLWHTGVREGEHEMTAAVELLLQRMCAGGLFDHLGGGFARYATDGRWKVPHFEKMLCDNALLVDLMTSVWRRTQAPWLRDRVEETVGWMLRELRLPGGGFASSLAAESGGEEGGFYLWSHAEVEALLGPDAERFCSYFDVTPGGNHLGRNVLNRLDAPVSDEMAALRLAAGLDRLRAARALRSSPARDDKVLADWNGHAIAALARAAIVFERDDWLRSAIDALDFVAARMMPEGTLVHSWCDGAAGSTTVLDDLASMALAASALFEVTGQGRFLERSLALARESETSFGSPDSGAFSYAVEGDVGPALRIVDGRDTATPSGNGMLAGLFARLYLLTGDGHWRTAAERLLKAFAGAFERDTYQLSSLLDASALLEHAVQVVVVGSSGDPHWHALVAAAHRHTAADIVVIPACAADALHAGHPACGKSMLEGAATAYVCAGQTCFAPVQSTAALARLLDETSGVLIPTSPPSAE